MLWGVEYLADVRAGREVAVKDRVVVIGGGNVAVDVALHGCSGWARNT